MRLSSERKVQMQSPLAKHYYKFQDSERRVLKQVWGPQRMGPALKHRRHARETSLLEASLTPSTPPSEAPLEAVPPLQPPCHTPLQAATHTHSPGSCNPSASPTCSPDSSQSCL